MRERDSALLCARCGGGALYVVSQRYEPEDVAGRLMPYCDPCRRDYSENIAIAVPIDVVRNDPDRVLTHLYRAGFTTTEPQIVSEMLQVPRSAWMDEARAGIDDRMEPRDNLSAVIAWAHTYNGYQRLAHAPEDLGDLVEPARRDYRVSGEIPEWCGVDLLRGWAFFMVRADRHGGGYGLSDPTSDFYREFAAVCGRLSDMPEAGPLDKPPVDLRRIGSDR